MTLASEHDWQPSWLNGFQDIANPFFVILFTVEMFVKLYPSGLQVGRQKLERVLFIV